MTAHDTHTRRRPGNHPPALTHLARIGAAATIIVRERMGEH